MEHTAMWQEIQDQTAVAETLLGLYLPQAERFHALLGSKKRVILTGTGASLYACRMARYAFYRYSGHLPTVLPADELCYVMDQIDRDTLTIFLSQSGESYETKLVSAALKERGIEFWGVTNEPGSHLAQNASEVLLLNCGVEVSSATKTNVASFLLLALIAGGWDGNFARALSALPGQIARTLADCPDAVEQWAGALQGEMQLYLLGAGVNGATAVEGALMLKEKTFIHAVGSSISDFRHGAVEVIEPGLPIVLLSSGAELGRACRMHADYFSGLGVKVFVVTDTPELFDGLPRVLSVRSAGVEELSPALTVLPLQLLAEAVARKKGLDVDGFRFLSKVVAAYGEG